jgi:hypothetical protein
VKRIEVYHMHIQDIKMKPAEHCLKKWKGERKKETGI